MQTGSAHHVGNAYAGTSRRDTICLEDGVILEQAAYPGGQRVLRVHAPKAAQRARAGTFAHIGCDLLVRMRRPLSIMRANKKEGWIDLLYKIMGSGLSKLARLQPGDSISLLAPIGKGFSPDPQRPQIIGLGGGVGMPPIVFLADELRHDPAFQPPMMFMGSELAFPFETVKSKLPIRGVPPLATDGIGLLESWGIPSRLASQSGIDGAFEGYVPTLARAVLDKLDSAELAQVQLMACGPEPMLRATAILAAEFDLPCQLAVEEFMACGVGGCAGCAVPIQTPTGPKMQRVCVDGPVFEAREVYPRVFSRS